MQTGLTCNRWITCTQVSVRRLLESDIDLDQNHFNNGFQSIRELGIIQSYDKYMYEQSCITKFIKWKGSRIMLVVKKMWEKHTFRRNRHLHITLEGSRLGLLSSCLRASFRRCRGSSLITWQITRGPWATLLTWENSSKSINTYDYIITLIKRRKIPLFT